MEVVPARSSLHQHVVEQVTAMTKLAVQTLKVLLLLLPVAQRLKGSDVLQTRVLLLLSNDIAL